MKRIGAALGALLLGLGASQAAGAHESDGWGGRHGWRHHGHHRHGWHRHGAWHRQGGWHRHGGWAADASCPGPYLPRGLVYNVPPCPDWASARVIRARY